MRFLLDIVVIFVFGATAIFLYVQHWDDIQRALFKTDPEYTIYLGATAVQVTVADTQSELIQGLSGVPYLRDLQGKLFIFDQDANYGIWMKDMLFPIDIIWIDKNLTVVYIAENIAPNTYPEIFTPSINARFVVEMNAHFVSSLRVKVGDRLTLPPSLLPTDIKENLQQ